MDLHSFYGQMVDGLQKEISVFFMFIFDRTRKEREGGLLLLGEPSNDRVLVVGPCRAGPTTTNDSCSRDEASWISVNGRVFAIHLQKSPSIQPITSPKKCGVVSFSRFKARPKSRLRASAETWGAS